MDNHIDRNGIPDMIQRDPPIAPPQPTSFGGVDPDPDPGLPGITTPIDVPAEPDPEPAPATMADAQHEAQVFSMLSSTVDQTIKSIGEGLSTMAREQ